MSATKTTREPTRHNVDELHDGDVVIGGVDPMPFVIENGERRPFESLGAFYAAGYEPDQVKVVDDPKLETMRLGQPLVALAPVQVFDTGRVFLGAGHYMRTWGTLDLGSGRIAAQTFIQTITWFGGFHGAATVIFADEKNAPVHQTGSYRYAVDGTAIGTSQRTSAWWEQLSPEDASRVTKIYIFQAWAPDSFQTILDKWVAAGQSLAQLAASVASVAKVVTIFV
jgi:hypothetical protein